MRFITIVYFALIASTSQMVLASHTPGEVEIEDRHHENYHDTLYEHYPVSISPFDTAEADLERLEARDFEELEARDTEDLESRELHVFDKRACRMTSQPGRNCNINTCRAGGGRCNQRLFRCAGTNMRGRNAPFECKINCRCSR